MRNVSKAASSCSLDATYINNNHFECESKMNKLVDCLTGNLLTGICRSKLDIPHAPMMCQLADDKNLNTILVGGMKKSCICQSSSS